MNISRGISKSLWFKLLVGVLSVFVIAGGFYRSAGAVPTGERLRNLAGPFLIGYASINNFSTLSDAAIYQETARTEFNFLTPENAMKFDALHPQQTTFTFTAADQHVQFAQANNMQVHGHTLVWHSQLPPWVTNGSWTAATLTAMMNNHIDTVMGHYLGQIAVWDVVNEAFNEDGSFRTSLWFNTIGQQYIELAFRRARMADPNAKLVYNDFNIEALGSKSNAVFNMVSDFKNRGVPIDGVGFQMHLTSGGINSQSLADNMQRFANLGVEIYITEMDVRYPTPISQANLTAQATIYRNVLNRCLLQPACKALQVWGFTDKYSWVPDTFQGMGDALIFDANYQAKAAYFALQSELMANPRVTPTPSRTPTRTPTPCASCPTNTFTPTPTRTNTPTVTPTLPPGVVKVQYRAADTNAGDNQMKPHFRLVNTGTTAVPLSELKIRYWFTRDTAQNQTFNCDFSTVGCGNITGSFVQLGSPVSTADFYVEVGFTAGAGSIAAGGTLGEIQTRINKNDFSNYNESNDYSFDTTKTAFADWDHVTLYRNGTLLWGVEPTGNTATNTPTPTPTRTNTPTNTPTPTFCPQATAEPLMVEPVTSPTNQLSQVITVRVGNGEAVTVTLESGVFTAVGSFTTSNPALVNVTLLPNTTHHLNVTARIRTVTGPGGCTFGGYTLSTTVDRFGAPLTIVQGSPVTFTPTPTNTPTSTPTRTNTPTNTPTRTNTPTITPTPSGAIRVQIMNGGTDNTQQAQFRFKVLNTGASAQANISVRVYFTLDGSQPASKYVLEKYWDQSGIATVSGPTLATGSTYFFTVSFGTTSLPAGGSWEFHTALHLNDWSQNFSSANDWWRNTGTLPASFTDWPRLPAFVGTTLVWGSTP